MYLNVTLFYVRMYLNVPLFYVRPAPHFPHCSQCSAQEDDHWLSDPRNVIQLHVTSPAWETGAAASSPVMSRAEQMQAWTVSETERFLQEHDLAGPSELSRVSGVNLPAFDQ